MKKIYILTCANEEGEVISCEAFNTREEARKEMNKQADREYRDAEESGYGDYIEIEHEDDLVTLEYGSNEYLWQIHEADSPAKDDDADHSVKSQFIEDTYFDLKAEDEGDVHILTEPVDGYDKFYLDEKDETIYVHNGNNDKWQSIFGIDTDRAYEISKQIRCGDYETGAI